MTWRSKSGDAPEGEEGPSTTMEEETTTRGKLLGLMVAKILGYIPLREEGAPRVRLGKNAKYSINIPATPKGIHVTTNIVPRLQKL